VLDQQHGGVLGDGTRYNDDRDVGIDLPDAVDGQKRRQPRHGQIAEHEIPPPVLDRLGKAALGVHPLPFRIEAAIFEIMSKKGGIVLVVLDDQNLEMHCG
jgi:hypothetical protein